MARGIDEGDHLARRRGDLVGADVLRDAAGLARDDRGLADRVEQRGLAVIDVPHDRDHRGTRIEILLQIRLFAEQAFFHVRLRHAAYGMAELFRDDLCRIRIDHVGDLVDLALLHQQADHVHGPLRHAVGEFLDRDRLRNRHLARQLLFLLDLAVAAHPLLAAAERRDRARALVLARGRRRDGEAAAIAVAAGLLRGLGRRDDLERHARTPDHALLLALLLGRLGPARDTGRGGSTRRTGRRGGRRRDLRLGSGRRTRHEVQVAGLARVGRDRLARLGGGRACRQRRTGSGRSRTCSRRRRSSRGRRSRGRASRSRCGTHRSRSLRHRRRRLGRRSRSGSRGLGAGCVGGAGGLFAGTLACFLGDPEALLLILAAAILLLALARLGGVALPLRGKFLLAALGSFLLGDAAGFLLAALGVGEGGGAGVTLLLAQRPQHDAGGSALGRARRRGCSRRHRPRRSGGNRLAGRSRGCRRGTDDTTLHRLDHDLLRAAVGEALANRSLLDRTLQRQRLRGGSRLRLVARIVRIAHSVQTLRVSIVP